MVNILFAQMDPPVLHKDLPVPSNLQIHFDSAPTTVTLHLSALGTDLTLTPDASGKIFHGTVPAGAILTGFTDTNVHRKNFGKITVTHGADPPLLAFLTADVLTSDVPSVSVVQVAIDTQRSENLVNIRFPTLADTAAGIDNQRAAICKKFYEHFDDDYDFIQIVIARTNFGNRGHRRTRVDAKGIGALEPDITAQFGSAGRLLGTTLYPNATLFDGGAPATVHEFGHQWINHLDFSPMKNGGGHWPLSDVAKDIMGLSGDGPDAAGVEFDFDLVPMGSDFKMVPNNDPKGFSDLSLYLMGMVPASQVGTHFVFNTQVQDFGPGILHGPVTNVPIANLITHEGPRTPDATKSQKRFRVATILVTRDSPASTNLMQLYDFFAKRHGAKDMLPFVDGGISGMSKPFRLATNGIGRLDPRIKRHILIDASRDGGVWWAPQVAPFSADKPHQGKALAQHLTSLGHKVVELPRPTAITPELLADFDIVIRVVGHGAYTAAEIAAYDAWVKDFGSLLLLADHHPQDALASHFGLQFKGIVRGSQKMSNLTQHPVTKGVGSITFTAGSGLTAMPAATIALGKFPSGSFLDVNDNNKKDAGEVSAPVGLGVLQVGQGRILFCGDANLWESVPQPLVKNALHWLSAPVF